MILAAGTSTDHVQVIVSVISLIITGVFAFLTFMTSRKATTIADQSKDIARDAAVTARAAADTQRSAYEFERERTQRLERLELVSDLLKLHNDVHLVDAGTSSSTWWWDLDTKVTVACEIHGWTEIGELWAFAKERYIQTKVGRESEFRWRFKNLAFRWAYDPATASEVTEWIASERNARGWDKPQDGG